MGLVQPLVIVGAGGFGREVAWLVEEINHAHPEFELLGFVDDAAAAVTEGYPVLSTIADWLAKPNRRARVVCAVGDPVTRAAIAGQLSEAGCEFATLIHPGARYSRWVKVGAGSVICAGTTLTTNVAVGAHSLLNLHCTVGHDAVLGEFTSMMPGVHISGEVATGQGVYFGTGAAVINQVTIGSWVVVGAGAVVTGDLPPRVVAVGVPAKPVKSNGRAPAED